MPWKEVFVLDLRKEMINDWLTKEFDVTELSYGYGVSRKTIYKWIERYKEYGIAGLEDLSREPHHHPNATPAEIMAPILSLKRKKMKWGPRKIIAKLRNDHPEVNWPAGSTGNNILKRFGLVKRRKHRRHTPPYTAPFLGCDQPNKVWSSDYKGQFRMGDNRQCYPLTISDNHSRYLINCWGLRRPTYEHTKPCFEWAFIRYGLPDAIRTDNGQPFASKGLGGLSRLAIWFIKLGIVPERIDLGSPEQNGRHERMHRTLKEYTASPPRMDLREQQKAFDDFKDEFNNERPHEALGQKPPSSVYRPSLRSYPAKLPDVEYDSDKVVCFVRNNGCIKWKGTLFFLSEALRGEYVALKKVDNHLWSIRFCFYPLGFLDEEKRKIIP